MRFAVNMLCTAMKKVMAVALFLKSMTGTVNELSFFSTSSLNFKVMTSWQSRRIFSTSTKGRCESVGSKQTNAKLRFPLMMHAIVSPVKISDAFLTQMATTSLKVMRITSEMIKIALE
jgi:hypothetical protein